MSTEIEQQPDIEALGLEAKAKREEKCKLDHDALMASANCQTVVVVRQGEMWVPINNVLNLPVAILVVSK